MCLGLGVLGGCETAPVTQAPVPGIVLPTADPLSLREGDGLRIVFPGAPNLNNEQVIRRDGRISMPLVGEIVAAGITPSELEKRLLEAYASQINTKEVTVTVISSSYAVFVSGAVMRPGKIISDRPLTALEAVMEAGGFDNAKADSKGVIVIRTENGRTVNLRIDLKAVIEGKQSQPFYLKPSDIVVVPDKFSWF